MKFIQGLEGHTRHNRWSKHVDWQVTHVKHKCSNLHCIKYTCEYENDVIIITAVKPQNAYKFV